jgi:hypothetical protein
VCGLLNLSDFVRRYGETIFSIMLHYGSKIVEQKVGVAPYMLGIIGTANPQVARLANELPLDGVTGYGLLPNWLGAPRQSYRALIDQRVAEWEHLQRDLRIPFYPVVCAGWDATVRGLCTGTLRAEDGYPSSPVVTGVSSELFGEFLDLAISFNARWQPRENIIFLHAWNEWTESSVIEASDRFRTTLLDEVRKRSASFGYVFDEHRPLTVVVEVKEALHSIGNGS